MEKNNESAFPIKRITDLGTDYIECPGLTKREYFAARALQGYLANGAYNTEQVMKYMQIKGLTLPLLAVRAANELMIWLDKSEQEDRENLEKSKNEKKDSSVAEAG